MILKGGMVSLYQQPNIALNSTIRLKGVHDMNRKLIFPLALLFILVMAAPACAEIQLDVNGKIYDTTDSLSIQEGFTCVPVDVLAHTLGCTVVSEGYLTTVQENQNILKMTIGSNTALLNGQEVQMPGAPQRMDGQVYVPMRFVYESLGASVVWNDAQNTIAVSYAESRDGMTAEQLLSKASEKMVEANSYKMSVDMKMDMDMTNQEISQQPEKVKMQMDSHIDAWTQAKPLLMYMKQNAIMKTPENMMPQAGPQNLQTEMVFNDSGMYMTMPGMGWVKMNLPGINLQELIEESMTQDAATTMQRMKDMGMSVSFANDQERNGQKYWVIDAAMGGDVFKSDYVKKFLKTSGMPQSPDMQKVLDGMDADISYTTWINQASLQTDFMDLVGKINMDMDSPGTEKPAHINMGMDLKGNYTLSDYGLTFYVPDVSQAVDFEKVLKQQK